MFFSIITKLSKLEIYLSETICFFLKSPEEAIKKVLLEFNKKLPNLSEKHLDKFLDILLLKEDKLSPLFWPKKSKNQKEKPNDFHISVWIFMKTMHQNYSEIMKMPLWLFLKISEDLEIICWSKDYDENRHSKKADKQKLKDIFGKSKTLGI